MSVIQPRTATVDIYQGDYLERIRHIEQQFDAARKDEDTAPRRLGELPLSATLREQHIALVAEAEESAIHVTLRALGRKTWRALVEQHKPREDNPGDKALGANEDTFKDALVPLSIVSPEFTEEDLDDMADIDYDRLFLTAFALNRSSAASPKALPASPETPKSDAT